MKHTLSALIAAALLAPSLAAAAPTFTVTGVEQVPSSKKVEIVDFSADSQDGASLSWVTGAPAGSDLALRCQGGERVKFTQDSGVVSYIRCDGKLHSAFRGKLSADAISSATLAATGSRPVKVSAVLKLYKIVDGKSGKLADKDTVTVKVTPEVKAAE